MRLVAATCSVLLLISACNGSARDRAGPATGTSKVASSRPEASGCRDNSDCAVHEYCAYSPALCGKGKSPGMCRARRAVCSGRAPVCGCDGKIYDTQCDAQAQGVDLDVMGGCTGSVADFIPCGAHYCDAHKSYCEIYLSDVLEPPPDHNCRKLPASCAPDETRHPSCDCFPAQIPCLSFCGPIWTPGIQGFHLTCQGVKAKGVPEPPTR